MSTAGIDRDELRAAVGDVMVREGGRLAEWHGWRCSYPERYGECNCNDAVATEIVREVLSLIADAIEAACKEASPTTQYQDGLQDGHFRAARLVRSLGGPS